MKTFLNALGKSQLQPSAIIAPRFFESLQVLILFGILFQSIEGVCHFITGRKFFIEQASKKPASDAALMV